MTDTHLFGIYDSLLRGAKEGEHEKLLEDIEESHYMDGLITDAQYVTLLHLFANLTGDYSILHRSVAEAATDVEADE